MKFHGVQMTGPFTNQRLATLPTWDTSRDQGRLVWKTDGTLWYGSDTEWVNVSSGSGDANEVEDMYSDLLRTTIFLNASFDEFADETRVASTTMTYGSKDKEYAFTNTQVIESINIYDALADIPFVDYILPSVDYVSASDGIIEVSSDGGTTWSVADNNQIFRIPTNVAGIDLRMRFTATATGTLYSWGILYNKDPNASCTKYGLTSADFEATAGQTTFETNYTPGAIQVFLNGDLLADTDYTATTGTEVVFIVPLVDGDLVNIVSFSTSILDPSFDAADYIRKDGSVTFTADQSMGGFQLTDVDDGVLDTDAVNKGQMDIGLGVVSDNLASLVSVPQNVVGGDITMSGNTLTVRPCRCIDSTGIIPLETLSNVPVTIPVTPSISNHIYIVRLISTGLCTIKSYPNDTDVDSDALINAYRWIDFWNTDGAGDAVPGKTWNGVKYFNTVSDLPILSGITSETWIPLDISTIVPVDKVAQWLPGATWTGGTTDTSANSSTFIMSHDGVTSHCHQTNYLDVAGDWFWGGRGAGTLYTDSISSNAVSLPPFGISVMMINGGTTANTWSVSFQKIHLLR